MRWNRWNTAKAKGKGKVTIQICDPSCAEGPVKNYKVNVTLLNIKNTMCGGQTLPMYRRAHLRYPDKKPPNKNTLRSFQLACSS